MCVHCTISWWERGLKYHIHFWTIVQSTCTSMNEFLWFVTLFDVCNVMYYWVLFIHSTIACICISLFLFISWLILHMLSDCRMGGWEFLNTWIEMIKTWREKIYIINLYISNVYQWTFTRVKQKHPNDWLTIEPPTMQAMAAGWSWWRETAGICSWLQSKQSKPLITWFMQFMQSTCRHKSENVYPHNVTHFERRLDKIDMLKCNHFHRVFLRGQLNNPLWF